MGVSVRIYERKIFPMENKLIFGCIADDFTGASDMASFLVNGGMKTILLSGIPEGCDIQGYDAAVIALKSRTQETSQAVADSLKALHWLRDMGCAHLYIKYCSTFDSTKSGNIGPIVDAALEEFGIPYTILCPALPVNGRTVYGGKLYVNGTPLDESPMKNHPLTPMWDCRIRELMRPQGKYPCMMMDTAMLHESDEKIKERINAFADNNRHFYIVPDYIKSDDAARLVSLFGQLPLLTGASGLAEELGRMFCGGAGEYPGSKNAGSKTLILAGSCSKATLEQIDTFLSSGGKGIKLFPDALADKRQRAENVVSMAEDLGDTVLIYSSDTPENVRKNQCGGKEQVSALLEETTARIACLSLARNFRNIIVAGGETSGAVTQALGFSSFTVGASAAPGVPVLIPTARQDIRLVLKSGNFGGKTFFEDTAKLIGT